MQVIFLRRRCSMSANTYGYARISTREQNEKRQMIALNDFGVRGELIYCDRQSSKDFARPQYKRMMAKLKPGDTLVIKSIDRLGRDYAEILEQWRIITKEREVAIVVLDMPLLDTRDKNRDLTGTFIADMVLQILSYVAQTEREFIRQRQSEGIAAALARGVKFGRALRERPAQYAELRVAWEAGRISARQAAECLGITHRTFLKWAREEQKIWVQKYTLIPGQ
jgi:DNA invertase Pin-like site-specific DNA recombinase